MKKSFTAKATVAIQAPSSQVWDALTNPAMIKQYLFGTETITTWKVGEPIIFKGVWEGKPYEDKGKILEMTKEKELQYSYWSSFSDQPDKPENYSIIRCTLSHQSPLTTLTITQDNCRTEQQQSHSEQNWKSVLNTLKGILEKG
jgi:uncharacterized protein YndB with AHSA1/START domain